MQFATFGIGAFELLGTEFALIFFERGVDVTGPAERAASDLVVEEIRRPEQGGRAPRVAQLASGGCEPVEALGQLALERQAFEPAERLREPFARLLGRAPLQRRSTEPVERECLELGASICRACASARS